jgi:hypothetical protein
MRTVTTALLVPLSLSLSMCGGKMVGNNDPSSATAPVASADDESQLPSSPTFAAAEEDGEWGTWQLLSVEGPNGKRQYNPPFVEIDLHSNGEAFLWRCFAASTGTGARCPYGMRHGCLVGTVAPVGTTWRVQFPEQVGTQGKTLSGEIVEDSAGDIMIDGTGALPAGGHYRRVAPASQDACVP